MFSWTVYGVCVSHVVIQQGCTNSECLVAQVIKFFKVVPNIFSIIIEAPPPHVQNLYQFTCNKHSVTGNSKVNR